VDLLSACWAKFAPGQTRELKQNSQLGEVPKVVISAVRNPEQAVCSKVRNGTVSGSISPAVEPNSFVSILIAAELLVVEPNAVPAKNEDQK
jgi:hypothetical protein